MAHEERAHSARGCPRQTRGALARERVKNETPGTTQGDWPICPGRPCCAESRESFQPYGHFAGEVVLNSVNSAKVGPCFGQPWPACGQELQISTESGPPRPDLTRCWTTLATAQSNLHAFGRNCPEFARFGPMLANVGPDSANMLLECRPDLNTCWRFGPELAQVGPSFEARVILTESPSQFSAGGNCQCRLETPQIWRRGRRCHLESVHSGEVGQLWGEVDQVRSANCDSMSTTNVGQTGSCGLRLIASVGGGVAEVAGVASRRCVGSETGRGRLGVDEWATWGRCGVLLWTISLNASSIS